MYLNTYNLSNVALFNNLSLEDINFLVDCLDARIKKYTKNEIIILEGTYIDSLGVVLDGSVQVSKTDIDGNRQVISSLQKDGVFAETYALSHTSECPFTVTSNEESVIMWLNVNRLLVTCSSSCVFHTKLIRNVIELLAEKNLYLNNKLDILSKRTLREKIIQFLYNYSGYQKEKHFSIPYNRLAMADYLGVDRSALSRELSQMKNNGLIDYNKSTFILY